MTRQWRRCKGMWPRWNRKFLFSPNLALSFHPVPTTHSLSPSHLIHRCHLIHSLSMAPQGKKCPGCLKLFTSHRTHLAQASSPLCRALAKKRKTSCLRFIREPRHNPQANSQPTSVVQDLPPTPTGDTLSSPEHTSIQDTPTSGDEDEWEIEDDNEDGDFSDTSEQSPPGWEPPVSDNADTMSVTSDNSTGSDSPPPTFRRRAWVEPKVVKFPNHRAGEPVCSVDPTNDTYATLLGSGSDSNEYSPFTSKTDWEIAKWAKLRGPSSTSLAELLKIEWVTLSYIV